MRTWLKLSFIITALVGCDATSQAAPFNRADVAPSPAWVVNLDVDGLRTTSIGKYLLSETAKPENKAKLAVLQSLVGIDVTTQLHGITLYSRDARPDNAVLIIYADFDPEKLNNLALAAKDPQSTTHDGKVIRSWLDEHHKNQNGEPKRTYGAIDGNRLFLGRHESTVADALDVIGSSDTLATSKVFEQLGDLAQPVVFEAAAQRLDLPDSDPNAAIFRLARQMRLRVGEADGQLHATLVLRAKDEQVAQQMNSIAQGLIALVKLQNKPDAVKLANALSIRQENNSLIGTLDVPAMDVVEAIKADAARKAATKAQNQ